MATGRAQVQLEAKDNASPVIEGAAKKAERALENLGKTSSSGLAQASRASDTFGISLSKIAKSFVAFSGLSKIVGGISSAFSSGISSVLNFDEAMARIGTLGPEVRREIGDLRAQLLALPPALGDINANAQAAFTALNQGAEASTIFDLVSASAAAATAGFAKTNDVIRLTNQILLAFNKDGSEATQVLDSIFRASQLGNAEFSVFARTFGSVIPLANQLGIQFEDAANAVSQFANITGDARTAGTAFRSLLNQLIVRQKEFAKAGIDVNKVISEEGFAGLMRKVAESTNGSAAELRNFISDVRGLNAAAFLSGAGLEKLTEGQESIRKASGVVADALDQQQQSIKAHLQNVRNAFNQMVVKLAGDDFPALGSALKNLEGFFLGVGNNAAALDSTFQFLAGEAAVLGGVLLNVGGSLVKIAAAAALIKGKTNEFRGELLKMVGDLVPANSSLSGLGKSLSEAGQKAIDAEQGTIKFGTELSKIGQDAKDTGDGLLQYALGMFESATNARTAGIETKAYSEHLADQKDAAEKAGAAEAGKRAATDQSTSSTQQNTTALGLQTAATDKQASSTESLGNKSGEVFAKITKNGKEFTLAHINNFKGVSEANQEFTIDLGEMAGAHVSVQVSQEALESMAARLGITVEELGKRVNTLNNKLGENSGQAKKSAVSAAEFETAWVNALGKTDEEIKKLATRSKEGFELLAQEGKISAKKAAEGIRAEFEKLKNIFGPNHPIVKEFQSSLKQMESDAGLSRNSLKDIFDDIGVSITLPVKDAPGKYKTAFDEMIASGEFTGRELSKIFIDQIKPKLLEAPNGVPQAWEAKFGETGRFAREFKELMDRNQDAIGAKAQSTASGFQAAYASALTQMGVDVTRFTGTWIEQSEARKRAMGQEVAQIQAAGGDAFDGLVGGAIKVGGSLENMQNQLARAEEGFRSISKRAVLLGGSPGSQAAFIRQESAILGDLIRELKLRIAEEQKSIRDRRAALNDTGGSSGGGGGGGRSSSNAPTPLSAISTGGNSAASAADATAGALREVVIQENERLRLLRKQREEITAPIRPLTLQLQKVDEQQEKWQKSVKEAQLLLQTEQNQLRELQRQGASQAEIDKLMFSIQGTSLDIEKGENRLKNLAVEEQRLREDILKVRHEEVTVAQLMDSIEAGREARLNRMQAGAAAQDPVLVALNTSATGSDRSNGRIAPLGGENLGDFGGGGRNAPSSSDVQEDATSTQENTQALQDNTRSNNRAAAASSAGRGTRVPFDQGLFGPPPRKDDTSLVIGDGAFVRGAGFAFQNGGIVPEDGLFSLEQGERVIPKPDRVLSEELGFVTNAPTRNGATQILTSGGSFSSTSFMPRFAPGGGSFNGPTSGPQGGGVLQFMQLAARGRLSDQLGVNAQRTLAKAVVPAQRQAIRRRDITTDITRNTPLSQQGIATVK